MTPDEALDRLDSTYHSPLLAVVRAEVEALRHDIARHVQISAEQAQEMDELRASLRELIGMIEIAAVMPDAINKHMRVDWDDPVLQRARAALAGEKNNGT